MPKYASQTKVDSNSSRAEIERTLQRYGASEFAYGWDNAQAAVMFALTDRRVRLTLPMPDRNTREFTHTPDRGLRRSAEAWERAYDQAVRQRWRALLLVIKAKLEAVDAGISTIEQEFLAFVMLPDGSTVGQWAAPQLESAYARNEMPKLLPGS